VKKKTFLILFSIGIVIKLASFAYVVHNSPDAMIQIDSARYLQASDHLMREGTFSVTNNKGNATPEMFRTPGYPVFVGILKYLCRLSISGIVLVQVILTVATSLLVYLTAKNIVPKISPVSALIILYDPTLTIYSMMILTEALDVFLLALVFYVFVKFQKSRQWRFLVIMAVCLAASTYVRPATYYLFIPVIPFILIATDQEAWTKRIGKALVFFLIYAALIGAWHGRNYRVFHDARFSKIGNVTIRMKGLVGSYERNEDPYTIGMGKIPYYVNVTSRCLLSLMTRPASLKYFQEGAVQGIGKVFGYLFITFWNIGLIAGILRGWKDRYLQLSLVIICYFIAVTIVGTMWGAGPRFRIPMMPFVAVVAGYGWSQISGKLKFRS